MKVSSVGVNEFDGAIKFEIELGPRINIIAGENGTGKTRLLQAIKSGRGLATVGTPFDSNRVFAVNPKRNTQRRDMQAIAQVMRQENKSYQVFSTEAINKHFEHGGFDNYSSFGEVFLYYFEKLDRSGENRIASMQAVTDEFNSVIRTVFYDYEIAANWDTVTGSPVLTILKSGMPVPLIGLSTGEAELFSLIVNLYTLRDQFDVFVIDEPETHLNWHLERLLFKFLKAFADDYDKQLVIATHSRIVADQELAAYAQFLYWEGGQVKVSQRLPREQREKLFDDAIQSLRIGDFSTLTIFCEDSSHRDYLETLLPVLQIEVFRISACGTSQNVKSLYKVSQEDGEWSKTLFLVDGDNQGAWKGGGEGFYQLPVYCVENYGLRLEALARVLKRDEADFRTKLASLLKGRKDALFEKSKSLNFLVDLLTANDLTQERIDQLDASVVFPEFVSWLGFPSAKEFWRAVFGASAKIDGELENFVDPRLLQSLRAYQQSQAPVKATEAE